MNITSGPVTLFLHAWSDPQRGNAVLDELSDMQRKHSIDIVGAGSLVCDQEGKFHTRMGNPDITEGTLAGLVTGLIVGLLGGPAFWLSAGAFGALSGGLVEHLMSIGFTKVQLEAIKSAMPPNSSAVFAFVYDNRVAAFEQQVATLSDIAVDDMIKVSLNADVASQLAQATKQDKVATR